jgi:hypothetical protein
LDYLERKNRRKSEQNVNTNGGNVGNELLAEEMEEEDNANEALVILKEKKEGKRVYMRVPLMNKVVERLAERAQNTQKLLQQQQQRLKKKKKPLTKAQVDLMEVQIYIQKKHSKQRNIRI